MYNIDMKTPTCKYCGKTGHYQYQCFEKNKAKARNTPKASIKAPQRTKKTKTPNNSSSSQNDRKKAIKRLDSIISQLVRIKYIDKQGLEFCYTCGKKDHWKNMDCGHYFKRTHIWTRFDPMNCRPQCKYCNQTLGGNYNVFKRKIERELSRENMEHLEKNYRRTDKMDTPFINDLIDYYSEQLEITKKFKL